MLALPWFEFFRLIQANPVRVVLSAHIRQNDRITSLQSFDHLNAVDRSTSDLHRNPHCRLAILAQLEQADRTVFIPERWTTNIKHVRHSGQIDLSIYAQVRPGALRQGPSKLYVNGHRSVHYSQINSHHLAIDNSVMRVNLCWLANLNITRLRLGDLQLRLELVRVY